MVLIIYKVFIPLFRLFNGVIFRDRFGEITSSKKIGWDAISKTAGERALSGKRNQKFMSAGKSAREKNCGKKFSHLGNFIHFFLRKFFQ